MNLISRIPKDFYKVFGSKYMEFYMQFLVAVYEESSQSYSLLGLTEGECQAIMNEQLARMTLDWSEERFDEEGELVVDMFGNITGLYLYDGQFSGVFSRAGRQAIISAQHDGFSLGSMYVNA